MASEISLSDRISALEEDSGRMDYRMKYSERLHRKVGEDGDIHHYNLMVPFVAVAAVLGGCAAILLSRKSI